METPVLRALWEQLEQEELEELAPLVQPVLLEELVLQGSRDNREAKDQLDLPVQLDQEVD